MQIAAMNNGVSQAAQKVVSSLFDYPQAVAQDIKANWTTLNESDNPARDWGISMTKALLELPPARLMKSLADDPNNPDAVRRYKLAELYRKTALERLTAMYAESAEPALTALMMFATTKTPLPPIGQAARNAEFMMGGGQRFAYAVDGTVASGAAIAEEAVANADLTLKGTLTVATAQAQENEVLPQITEVLPIKKLGVITDKALQDAQPQSEIMQKQNQVILEQFPDSSGHSEGKVYRQKFDNGYSPRPSFNFLTIERAGQPSKVLLEIPHKLNPFTYLEVSQEMVQAQHALADALSSPGTISADHLKAVGFTPFQNALNKMADLPAVIPAAYVLLDDIRCNMTKGMVAMRNDLLVAAVEQRAVQVLSMSSYANQYAFLVFKDATGQASVVLRVIDNRYSLGNAAIYLPITPELVESYNQLVLARRQASAADSVLEKETNNLTINLIQNIKEVSRAGGELSLSEIKRHLSQALNIASKCDLEIPTPSHNEVSIPDEPGAGR